MLSHVLVVGPKKDPKIQRALQHPRFDVHFTNEPENALKLLLTLTAAVIVLDLLVPGLDVWKLISRILKVAGKRGSHPPAVILLTDQVTSWQAADLGRVRTSDREHLRETFSEAVKGLEESPTDGSLERDTSWDAALAQVKARGDKRFKSEQARMRRLGILDERGEPTSKEWPADMTPGSKTDVAT